MNITCFDLVIPENSWGQKIKDIEEYGVDIFGIGKDWEGKFDFLRDYCDVIYLERTKDVSTTCLKKSLKFFLSVSPQEILKAFQVLDQLRKDLE